MDFEAELEKFQPSLDIDKAEDAITGQSIMDVTDIIHAIMQGPEVRQRGKQSNNSVEWVEGI